MFGFISMEEDSQILGFFRFECFFSEILVGLRILAVVLHQAVTDIVLSILSKKLSLTIKYSLEPVVRLVYTSNYLKEHVNCIRCDSSM